MPSVFNYLHHRIIDVTTFHAMIQRWSAPEKWAEKNKYIDDIIHERYPRLPDGNEIHRAMYGVETGMEILKLFKTCFETF